MNVIARDFRSYAALDWRPIFPRDVRGGEGAAGNFLSGLGLETISSPYAPSRLALAIPYRNADGSLHRERIRAGLIKSKEGSDRRMLWDRQPDGHGTILYGLDGFRLGEFSSSQRERATPTPFGCMALRLWGYLVRPTSSRSATTVISRTVTSSSSWRATRAA